MLKPALLYANKLRKKQTEIMYDIKYQFYYGSSGAYITELEDNNEYAHQLVSVDDKGNVLGFISYRINPSAQSCYHFGLVSFDIGNVRFALDVRQAIYEIFYKYQFNRIEWCCFEDSPHIDGYEKFIHRFGGSAVGIFKETNRLMDGKLHNKVCFELMRKDYLKAIEGCERIRKRG